MSMVFDTPEGIAFYRLATLKHALAIEVKTGLKHSRFSPLAIAKRDYGLKGSKASVLAQLETMVEAAIAAKQGR